MGEVKKMKDEMNNAINEALLENVQTLIPDAWKPKINEMLPKILGLIKHGLKASLKKLTEELGENKKIFMVMNVPAKGDDGVVFFRPKFMIIETSQLEAFNLKAGEILKVNYPLTAIVEKIESYKTAEKLLADLSSGDLFSIDSSAVMEKEKPKEQEQQNEQTQLAEAGK